jgi:hypothetical protein
MTSKAILIAGADADALALKSATLARSGATNTASIGDPTTTENAGWPQTFKVCGMP